MSLSVTIHVKVLPKSSKRSIVSFDDQVLKVKLTSAPEKGKANKELIEYLAKALKIKKSSVRILKGETSPQKLLKFENLDQALFLKKLDSYFKSS